MARCEACAGVFRALGDDHRLRIIRYLRRAGTAVSVGELLELLEIAQPTLAHHMKILTQAGLVNLERQGRCVMYTLNKEKFKRMGECLVAITHKCEECSCPGAGCEKCE